MATNPAPRVALFGGSFDPVHLGHLVMAEDAVIHLNLDVVIFLPAWHAPLKDQEPWLDAPTRVGLLQAAVRPFPRFRVSRFETGRKRRVYAIESVRHFHARLRPAKLYFLIGADQANRLGEWREVERLAGLATFACASRSGSEAKKASPVPIEWIPARRCDISSTEIRQRHQAGLPFGSLVPAPVARRLSRPPGA